MSGLLLQTLDWIGTIAFALSGALAGIGRRLDIFGVIVLAFLTAVAGGVTRDVLIGSVPPEAIANWHPLAISAFTGLAAFFGHRWLGRIRRHVLVFDAAGLGVFAVTGAAKALDFGLSPPMAAVLGMVSGIGGGIVRDVLTAQIPTVLTSEIYAVAALAGAGLAVAGISAGVPDGPSAAAGVALCFCLRMVSVYRGFGLPRAG